MEDNGEERFGSLTWDTFTSPQVGKVKIDGPNEMKGPLFFTIASGLFYRNAKGAFCIGIIIG